jgi:hypothetical protein
MDEVLSRNPGTIGGAVVAVAGGCGGLDDARWRSLLDQRSLVEVRA